MELQLGRKQGKAMVADWLCAFRQALLPNSEESKDLKLKPGFSGYYESICAKLGCQNIFYLFKSWQLDFKFSNI